MSAHLLRRATMASALVTLGTAPALAQRPLSFTAAPRPNALDRARPDDEPRTPRLPGTERVTLAAVTVSSSPGALEVVSIPVPAALRGVSMVRYAISPIGRARLFGRTAGTVGLAGARSGAVMITVGTPSLAVAGQVQVAVAEFAVEGGAVSEVPIMMNVAPVRRVEFTVIDRMTGALLGDVATIRYRVVNFGNRPDTVSVDAVLPAGWRLARGAQRGIVVLPIRGAREGALSVWVPPSAAVGASLVHVVATAGGATVASFDVNVEVRDPRNGGRLGGPALTMSAIAASVPGGRMVNAYFATVEGPVTDSIRLSARAGWTSASADGAAGSALARLGGLMAPPSLSLTSPIFSLGLGLTGGSLSELTGYSVNGTGASGSVRLGGWRMTAIGARPYEYGFSSAESERLRTPTGGLAGGSLVRAVDAGSLGEGSFTITASHLSEPQSYRRLDAAGAGAQLHSALFGDLSSELGYRRYAGGAGLGWNTEVRRQGPSGSLNVRLLHAPGGTRAFARAANELSAAGARQLRPWLSLDGSYWKSGDENVTFGSLASSGWSAGPRFSMPSRGATLSVEARGASFDATSASGQFGNAETQLTAALDVRRGAFFGTATGGAGRYTRTVATAGGALPDDDGQRAEVRGSLGATLLGGATAELSAGLQRYATAYGAAPQQRSVGARVDRLPVPITFGVRLLAGAEVQRSSFGIGAPVTTSRLSLSAPLPAGFSLSVSAERNPYLTAAAGGERGRWMTAMRIERTSFLPRLTTMGNARRVYQDLNGNGARDDGEPGVANAIVRCGDQSAVTDRQGRFKCGASGEGYVDPRSVPAGTIAPATDARHRSGGDIGLIAVKAVRVRVVLVEVDTMRVPVADLAKVLVIARDSSGQPWVARAVDGGMQLFDALPPGRYTLDADVSAIDEPLTAGGSPTFTVDGGPAPVVDLRLHGRAVKIRQLPATSELRADTKTANPVRK